MRSLKPKILLYLLALWTGLAGVSALGYMRLKAVHNASSELIHSVYPSAAAALEVESAIHEAYQNTIIYCSYLQIDAKTETELALEKADQALNTYFSVSRNTPPETFAELRALLDDAKTHALDCLRATDEGMTPAEFQQHIGMLNDVQVRVVLALREAATREQQNMLAGTQHIDEVVVDVEFDFKRADGTTFPGRINSTAFYDDNGRFLHSRSSVRDITREKELHKQLLQSQKLESLGTLSGGIAHDFNNLLTSIMGFSQLAMIEHDPNSKTYQNLERVVKLGDQAAGLTRQLLTFSRKTPMEKHPISAIPLVKETIKVLERTLPETIRISTDIQPNTATIEADATQIQQVLMNLCVNARDAMPDGGALSISLRDEILDEHRARQHGNRPAGPYVCLEIKDTGMGMPPDVQEHIFEPFFTTKEVGKGTGLGLSIVHGIVESHGGHIRLSSQPGKGTAFSIFLPAAENEATPEEKAKSLPTSGCETILLVEDDPNVLETAHHMLTSQGYRVLTATDGKQGLETYLQHQNEIDLIISDLVMPETSGIEMGLEIERIAPDARMLLISGYVDRTQNSECKIVAGFLPKPFKLNTLCTSVRNIIDQTPIPA